MVLFNDSVVTCFLRRKSGSGGEGVWFLPFPEVMTQKGFSQRWLLSGFWEATYQMT